ncbi:hypothetical protein NW765_017685, partial [Fusarium oxysporum]
GPHRVVRGRALKPCLQQHLPGPSRMRPAGLKNLLLEASGAFDKLAPAADSERRNALETGRDA